MFNPTRLKGDPEKEQNRKQEASCEELEEAPYEEFAHERAGMLGVEDKKHVTENTGDGWDK